jgi:hypothetical protein
MVNDRFLLIKGWSSILWADVEHLLSQLLIAELTKRTPVVFWPTHCLHNGFVHTNGFELYFEPISRYTIFDIAKPEYTYYPPIWDSDNLLVEDLAKDTWNYRNIGDIMGNDSNVVIGDVYIDMYSLIPFITKDHPAYGMTVRQINAYMFRKYIRIKKDIEAEIQGFYNSWLKDEGPVLAVHVCKADKSRVIDLRKYNKKDESHPLRSKPKRVKKGAEKPIKAFKVRKGRKILEPNAVYYEEISKYIEKYNVKKIFLLTNCEEVLEAYTAKYGDMLVYTQCKRIEKGGNASYMENTLVKRRRGVEAIKDTFIASKCDFFIGNDFSSLSHAVTYAKVWPENTVRLLYWQFRNRKYPVNVPLLAKREGNKFFKFVAGFFRKIFKKDRALPV